LAPDSSWASELSVKVKVEPTWIESSFSAWTFTIASEGSLGSNKRPETRVTRSSVMYSPPRLPSRDAGLAPGPTLSVAPLIWSRLASKPTTGST
jgi:hypothetical protein